MNINTVRNEKGINCYDAKTKELIGIMTGSVGPYGTSTGIFTNCEGTSPFNELKLIRECGGLDGSHMYDIMECPKCGCDFCFDCCGNTNVTESPSPERKFMECPMCGENYY